MSVRIIELHHHAVRVPTAAVELERVRRFYAEVLGLQSDGGRPGFNLAGDWLNIGEHAQMHLMAVEPAPASGGIEPTEPHVAFAVADIGEARRELERHGVEVREFTIPGAPSFLFFRDPAGNLIELHQHGRCRCTANARAASSGEYARLWSAVMFADMRGFTAISEQLTPTDVLPLLNEYFGLLTGIAMSHQGTVFSMAGDGLMVGFGVPDQRIDAPELAVVTAREMLAGFRDLAAEWKRRLGIDTGLGIGINAGEVIAGNVGSANYMSYTIIGDTVNVASRLSQRARAGEALFSGTVKRSLDQLGCEVRAVELPAMQVRGRASPVEIFCLPTDSRVDFRPAAA